MREFQGTGARQLLHVNQVCYDHYDTFLQLSAKEIRAKQKLQQMLKDFLKKKILEDKYALLA